MEKLGTILGTHTTSFGKWCKILLLDYSILTQFQKMRAFVHLICHNSQYRIIGMYGKNSIDWVLTEQSCNAYNFSICPVYDTLGADSVEFILQQTAMKTCVCGKEEVLKVRFLVMADFIQQLLTLVDKTPDLKTIIQSGPVDKKTLEIAKDHVRTSLFFRNVQNITILTTQDVMAIGHDHRVVNTPPRAEDVCTICYTSGTTGVPKGALITHRNLASAVSGCLYTGICGRATDVYLSYLPLAHVLERIMNLAILMAGGRIGFYQVSFGKESLIHITITIAIAIAILVHIDVHNVVWMADDQGDTREIVSDIKALRPTIFTSVPRL